MESCGIIDLCEVKSEKSFDTSDTVPFDVSANTTFSASNERAHKSLFPKVLENDVNSKALTEQWIRQQNTAFTYTNELEEKQDDSCCHTVGIFDMIPIEITDLVNKECVIKLINHLVIYAINKVTEADLRRKLLSITPDVDPQINYRSNIGFQCVYERCVVLFYEALLDLFDIIQLFESEVQNIVVLWMYGTVETICKAHAIDSTFLRNEKYIETMFEDFMISQNKMPEPGNIFFNIYQKMLPTMPSAASIINTHQNNAKHATKKPRKPRVKKLRTDAPSNTQ